MGRKSKEEGIYVHVQLIHFAVQQKLTQHWKATILQKKCKKKKKRLEFDEEQDIHKISKHILQVIYKFKIILFNNTDTQQTHLHDNQS